jgi:hypothetical protein
LRGDRFVDEGVQACLAEQIEHLGGLIRVGPDVAAWKIGGVGKCVGCDL